MCVNRLQTTHLNSILAMLSLGMERLDHFARLSNYQHSHTVKILFRLIKSTEKAKILHCRKRYGNRDPIISGFEVDVYLQHLKTFSPSYSRDGHELLRYFDYLFTMDATVLCTITDHCLEILEKFIDKFSDQLPLPANFLVELVLVATMSLV